MARQSPEPPDEATGPLDLARDYLFAFCSGDLDRLAALLADDLVFEGPLVNTYTAGAYLAALAADPPADVHPEIIHESTYADQACLVYRLPKPDGPALTLAQVFWIHESRIDRILTLFDPSSLTP